VLKTRTGCFTTEEGRCCGNSGGVELGSVRTGGAKVLADKPFAGEFAVNSTEEVVFSAALALPEQSRAHLADMLWASLPEERLDLFVTDEVRQAWAAEGRRRMRDVASGKVALLPGDEVMGRLRSRLQR
jgi:putative addiction module component (TIGR02574 family)